MAIAFALSMFNNILPSRAGEVTLIHMTRRHQDLAAGHAAAVLILARLFDVFAVAILFVTASLLSLATLPAKTGSIIRCAALFVALPTVVLLSLPWLGQKGLRVLERTLARRRLIDRRVFSALLRALRRAVSALQGSRTARTYGLTAPSSFAIWLCTFSWF